MSATPPAAVEAYAATCTPDDAAVVRALDAAIRSVKPDFAVAVKYNILMYAVAGDWRHWVVAIDAHPKPAIGLRFLWGVILDDPQGVLRGGTSVLKTWDLARGRPIDAEAVAAFVSDAVAKYPEYKANEAAIQASAKTRGGSPT